MCIGEQSRGDEKDFCHQLIMQMLTSVRLAFQFAWKILSVSTPLDRTCATVMRDTLEMDLSCAWVLKLFLPYDESIGFYFIDINECDLSLDNCDRNAVCVNVAGSFNCTCKLDFGFDGNGTHCGKSLTYGM